MSGIRRYTVALIIIISTFLNIFISYFHFGHHDHIINPVTGKIEHTHECSGDHNRNGNDKKAEGSAFEQQIPNSSADSCRFLDILLKQSLRQSSFTQLAVNFVSITFINFSDGFFEPVQNILSFAPKNSPPVA